MSKSKTVEDLAPICRLPQGNPVEAIGDYFQSLMESSSLIRKPQPWDNAGKTSLQVRESARMEADEAEEKLENTRMIYAKKRRQMDGKWESLRERQYKLRYTFIKFNKLLCENHNKRERALAQIEVDEKLLEKKSQETEDVREQLKNMIKVCEDMEKYIEEHSMYEDYLMSVVNMNKYFRQPSDILNTFEALARTKNILSQRQESDLAAIIELQSDSAKIMENRLQHLMTLNNKLANLRIRYDWANNKVRVWEGVLTRVYKTTSHTQVELARVRDSLWDFYCNICKQKGMEPTTSPEDFDTQLIYVYKGILELRAIVAHTNTIMAKQVDSNVIQTPSDS